MNTAAAKLLQSLDILGVQSVRFRILGLGEHVRHTIPVAQTIDESSGKRLSELSVSELFSAYSLVPRRGEYVLDVDNATLSFIPPTMRPIVVPARLTVLKKRRSKSRHVTHHKLAA